MKRIITIIVAVMAIGVFNGNAQSDYTFAAGLGLDMGSGATFIGPSAKYFFSDESAVQAEITFESIFTSITGLYEYHGDITNVDGLKWFAGGGASIWLGSNGFGSAFALRPTVGLDYKISDVPLAFSFDWRPLIGIGDNIGSEVAFFGLGVRYVIE